MWDLCLTGSGLAAGGPERRPLAGHWDVGSDRLHGLEVLGSGAPWSMAVLSSKSGCSHTGSSQGKVKTSRCTKCLEKCTATCNGKIDALGQNLRYTVAESKLKRSKSTRRKMKMKNLPSLSQRRQGEALIRCYPWPLRGGGGPSNSNSGSGWPDSWLLLTST